MERYVFPRIGRRRVSKANTADVPAIVSPSSEMQDQGTKRALYGKHGVTE